MSHEYLQPLQQGSRAAVMAKIAEHDDALNALEAAGPSAQLALFSAPNGDSVILLPGMPLATAVAAGQVRRGDATSTATASILGLATTSADLTLPVVGQSDGKIELSTAQWDAVTGGSGGLVPGARYYLDVAPGMITTTPPSAPGTSVTALGRALSSTDLILHIMPYVYQ